MYAQFDTPKALKHRPRRHRWIAAAVLAALAAAAVATAPNGSSHHTESECEEVPFALQTLDYARAILTKCSTVLELPGDSEATAAVRLQRQTVLDLPGHRFHMLIGEEALLRTVGNAEIMTAQIRSLTQTLPERDHVKIGIIPLNAEFTAPTTNFVTQESTGVDIEAVTGAVEATDEKEIALAGRTFDLLATQAVYGQDARAILDLALAGHADPRV